MGKAIKLIILVFFLGACASAAEPTATPTATVTRTPTATQTPSPTPSPTPMPTPMGGGGYPLFAVVLTDRVGQTAVSEIEIIELETERTIAAIPINESGTNWDESRQAFFSDAFRKPILSFSPDGRSLAYNDIVDEQMGILVYDLDTGETRTLFTLPAFSVEDIQWSFDGRWLSYVYWQPGSSRARLGLYDFGRDSNSFVSSAYKAYWYAEDNRILYIDAGSNHVVLDVETGAESRSSSLGPNFSLLQNHHNANISNMGCGLCFIPKFGLFEVESSTQDRLTEFYDLINPETREFIFSATYARPNSDTRIRVLDVLSLTPGNFLLYILEEDWNEVVSANGLYTVWDPRGDRDLDINLDHSLVDTMPLAVSPDGTRLLVLCLNTCFCRVVCPSLIWRRGTWSMNTAGLPVAKCLTTMS